MERRRQEFEQREVERQQEEERQREEKEEEQRLRGDERRVVIWDGEERMQKLKEHLKVCGLKKRYWEEEERRTVQAMEEEMERVVQAERNKRRDLERDLRLLKGGKVDFDGGRVDLNFIEL